MKLTRQSIISATIPLLATNGYQGTSMRDIANAVGIEPSVLYYHFPNKQSLFAAVRNELNSQLDHAVHQLPPAHTSAERLRQRIAFNLDHMEEIVALLQYFMATKDQFSPVAAGGYVPERAYTNIVELIDAGIAEGVYRSDNRFGNAKIITHLINGFLLEYYSHHLTKREREMLTEQIADFIENGMHAKGQT